MNATPGRRHRVVIVGGGFGGLQAAKALRRAAVDVTVIDRTNHHLVQPLLHQLATGILSEGDIARPIRDLLRRQQNTRVLLGEVVDIDLDARARHDRHDWTAQPVGLRQLDRGDGREPVRTSGIPSSRARRRG